MSQWIDFKSLRRDLNFEKVLVAYGVSLHIRDTPHGRQHSGPCPLKACKGRLPAKANFSANVTEGIWRCFGCGNHGNTLDFTLFMEGLNPLRGDDVRKGALRARARFLDSDTQKPVQDVEPVPPKEEMKKPSEGDYAKTLVNEPLDFALKSLDPTHEWFKAHGLSAETVAHFGLGGASRGTLKGRIAIPLHDDTTGELLGYAGRRVDEGKATEKDPVYLFPEPRVRSGIRHVFDRSKFLYHGHAVKAPVNRLLVVSDMMMVWWLWQHGFGNVVSTMGKGCEDAQAKRACSLVQASGIVAVLARKGEDGCRLAREVAERCGAFRPVRWYAADVEPLSLDAVALQSLLGLADTPVP